MLKIYYPEEPFFGETGAVEILGFSDFILYSAVTIVKHSVRFR